MECVNPIWVTGKIGAGDWYIQFTGHYAELMAGTRKREQITLFINSRGGDIETALGVYDLLRCCGRRVVGIVAGTAQSGASLILQAAQERVMTLNSTLMLHKTHVQTEGTIENAQEGLNSFRRSEEKFYEIYAERSGLDIHKIAAMAEKAKHFTAEEALKAGLIDTLLR